MTLPFSILVVSAILLSYLLGSVNSSLLVAKAYRLSDPRKAGSKNPGATNMLRLYGKKVALITLIGDGCKGVIAVAVAKALEFDSLLQATVLLCVFMGHLYPIFFNFRGGKGVATLLGAMIVFMPSYGILMALLWFIIAKGFGISSLAGVLAPVLMTLFGWYHLLLDDPTPILIADFFSLYDPSAWLLVSLAVIFLIARHKSNLVELMKKKGV